MSQTGWPGGGHDEDRLATRCSSWLLRVGTFLFASELTVPEAVALAV